MNGDSAEIKWKLSPHWAELRATSPMFDALTSDCLSEIEIRSKQRIKPMNRNSIFRIICLAFIAAGLFHLHGLIMPREGDHQSPLRHLSFVVINGLVVVGLRYRPRFFVLIFGAFAVQQVLVHGRRARYVYEETGMTPWIDIAVLIVVPAVLLFLIWDFWAPPSQQPTVANERSQSSFQG